MTKLATYDDESLFCFRWIWTESLSRRCRDGSAHIYTTRGKTKETKPKNATQNLLSNECAHGTYRNLCNWIHDGFCILDFCSMKLNMHYAMRKLLLNLVEPLSRWLNPNGSDGQPIFRAIGHAGDIGRHSRFTIASHLIPSHATNEPFFYADSSDENVSSHKRQCGEMHMPNNNQSQRKISRRAWIFHINNPNICNNNIPRYLTATASLRFAFLYFEFLVVAAAAAQLSRDVGIDSFGRNNVGTLWIMRRLYAATQKEREKELLPIDTYWTNAITLWSYGRRKLRIKLALEGKCAQQRCRMEHGATQHSPLPARMSQTETIS